MTSNTTGGTGSDAKPRNKLSGFALVLVIISALIGAWAGSTLFTYASTHLFQPSIDEALAKESEKINATTPRMIDKITRLDKTSTPGQRRIIYSYTLIEGPDFKLDPTKVESGMRPIVLKTYQTSPDMKYFRDNGVTMGYVYWDEQGNKVAEFEVGPADLK